MRPPPTEKRLPSTGFSIKEYKQYWKDTYAGTMGVTLNPAALKLMLERGKVVMEGIWDAIIRFWQSAAACLDNDWREHVTIENVLTY